jgi:hypothetical protein
LNDATQQACLAVVKKFKEEERLEKSQLFLKRKGVKRRNRKKDSIRNDLFLLLLPYLYRWLVSALKKKGIYKGHDELLSLCWDSFSFALDNYTNLSVPIPDHFNRYISFYIRDRWWQKEEQLGMKLTGYGTESAYLDPDIDIADIVHMEDESDTPVFSLEGILKELREYLDSDNRIIFDDAATGAGHNRIRCRGESRVLDMPGYRYDAAKKIYKIMIRFLIKVSRRA